MNDSLRATTAPTPPPMGELSGSAAGSHAAGSHAAGTSSASASSAGISSEGASPPQPVSSIAPPASRFPAHPVSWYLFGHARELARGPVSKDLMGRRVVLYRTESGRFVAMDARCSHLGADLGRGCVAGESIRCPFHDWEYAPDGRCARIPAASTIPDFARQAPYPVQERHGLVFVFNGREALFPLPFFPDTDPAGLSPVEPFDTTLAAPWFMVGANAFDLQHFKAAHDRRLAGPPAVTCPAAFARRASAEYEVAGDTLRDKVTRLFAGDRVTMTVTDWCGNLIFVTARFRRTTSYGMVAITPLGPSKTAVRVTVFVPRSPWAWKRATLDRLHGRVRRYFIREFLRSDAERLDGVYYNPAGLIDADRDLAEYFRWLSVVSHGTPFPGWEQVRRQA